MSLFKDWYKFTSPAKFWEKVYLCTYVPFLVASAGIAYYKAYLDLGDANVQLGSLLLLLAFVVTMLVMNNWSYASYREFTNNLLRRSLALNEEASNMLAESDARIRYLETVVSMNKEV